MSKLDRAETFGMPAETLWETIAGMSPEEIERESMNVYYTVQQLIRSNKHIGSPNSMKALANAHPIFAVWHEHGRLGRRTQQDWARHTWTTPVPELTNSLSALGGALRASRTVHSVAHGYSQCVGAQVNNELSKVLSCIEILASLGLSDEHEEMVNEALEGIQNIRKLADNMTGKGA